MINLRCLQKNNFIPYLFNNNLFVGYVYNIISIVQKFDGLIFSV